MKIGRLGRDQVLERLEDGIVAFVDGYSRAAGTSVRHEKDCAWAEPQVGFSAYGVVAKLDFSDRSIDVRLAEVQEQAGGGCWWVTPISRPSTIAQRLVAMGATQAVQLVGMAAEIHDVVRSADLPEEVRVVRVETADQVESYARTYPRLFTDEPGAWAEDVVRLNLASFRSGNDPFHRWLAVLGDQPISAGMTMKVGDMAVLQTLCTLKEHRGRGIGSVLISRALDEERENGCTYAGLWAGPGADRLYTRLGFQTVGTADLYCL